MLRALDAPREDEIGIQGVRQAPRARLCDPSVEAGESRAACKAALRNTAPTTSSAHLTPAG